MVKIKKKNKNKNQKPKMTADVGDDVEKEEHSSIAVGTTLWKSFWQFLRNLEVVLPQYPAILLLGMYKKCFNI